jgi:hypothetical protein
MNEPGIVVAHDQADVGAIEDEKNTFSRIGADANDIAGMVNGIAAFSLYCR